MLDCERERERERERRERETERGQGVRGLKCRGEDRRGEQEGRGEKGGDFFFCLDKT